MLNHGANPNICFEGVSVLRYAIREKNDDVIQLLCYHGADVNKVDNDRCFPLLDAILYNRETIIHILSLYSVDFNQTSNYGANYGDNFNERHNYRLTPLKYAIKLYKINMINLLCEKGANINLQTKNGETALMFAIKYCRNNKEKIIEFLCKKGANINLQNNKGETALMFEIKRYSNDTEVAKILCEKGANVNLQNNKGETALFYAIKYYRKGIIKILYNKMANNTIVNSNGDTPLKYAKKRCQAMHSDIDGHQLSFKETIASKEILNILKIQQNNQKSSSTISPFYNNQIRLQYVSKKPNTLGNPLHKKQKNKRKK